MAKRLDSVALLMFEHVHDILSGQCICTNARFRDTFKLLRQNADLGVLHNTLRTIPDNATPMEEIEAVLDLQWTYMTNSPLPSFGSGPVRVVVALL